MAMSLPEAGVDQRQDVLDELGWRLFHEGGATHRVVDRLHLLDHHEPGQG